MTTMQAPRTRGLFIALLCAVLVLMPGLGVLTAAPADSAPRLSITSAAGTNRASADGPTKISVSGSGFQSINKGFGGIYVVFGYVVNSNWRPSQGGKGDKDFLYVADSQAKDNKGYQRFVAFPGSSTADSANGGVLSANGSFKLSMVIPGPTFTAATASGAATSVDCREVQCGIITFGAHGVVNGGNEAFQPISFGASAPMPKQGADPDKSTQNSTAQNATTTTQAPASPEAQAPAGEGKSRQEQGSDLPETGTAAPAAPQAAAAAGDPMLGLEQQTVIAGRSLGFTGRGFAAGEQVVATLSSGLTAAGPIAAGQFGEIAGAVQIPSDTTAGTHKIKLTGAGSGNSVEAEFSVMADASLLPVAGNGEQDKLRWAMIAVIAAAGLLFILVLSSLIAALARKGGNKGAKQGAAGKPKRPAARKRRRRTARTRTAPRPKASVPVADNEPDTSALDRLDESLERERV